MAKRNKVTVVLSSRDDLHIRVVRSDQEQKATHTLEPIDKGFSPPTSEEMNYLMDNRNLPDWFLELRNQVTGAEDSLQAWRGLTHQLDCNHSVGETGMPDPETWVKSFDPWGCSDADEKAERAGKILARWVIAQYKLRLYILSAQVVPIPHGDTAVFEIKPIQSNTAKELCAGGNFVSAVGHDGTAEALSSLLGIKVPMQRLAVFMRRGDRAIQFVLRQRQPEGVVLDRETVEKIGYHLTLVSRVN
ncbi:MAG: DUF1874 domain-containing protein [Candidatus Nealsonbacteria bacterium]|nr:DUF1874 domain-containing protein [Candidatus Nealsonbacteria bacterium]